MNAPAALALVFDVENTGRLPVTIIKTRPCEGFVPGGSITCDSVTLRYSYARFFEREKEIKLPVAMLLIC